MFQFIRELGSGRTNTTEMANKAIKSNDRKDSNLGKKNKAFRLRRKNVMEELENLTTKYPYHRPVFLGLRSNEELQMALRHAERPLTLPKRSVLPKIAGYAECVNGGKSLFNEDQASAVELNMEFTNHSNSSEKENPLHHLEKVTIFGVFDGHAGADVAVTVSHELPHRIKERLWDVIDEIRHAYTNNVQEDLSPQTINAPLAPGPSKRKLTVDRLVTGALEAAFRDMDTNLVEDAVKYTVKGGCAALVTLFYANKLYIANAGDCRAVVSIAGEPTLISHDFTPETERRRLQKLAEQHPDLLADEFCPLQFAQRVTRKDVGTQMLFRDSGMEGWAHKEVVEKDLRFPMIMGDGRRSRLLATIGLTRGLGDHNLKVFDSAIHIKPFLSCTPEVQICDLSEHESSLTPNDVIILGSDGLWDVTTNEQALWIVDNVLRSLPVRDDSRYIAAAQALVAHARGMQKVDRKDVWVLKDSTEYASHDDITCFVIPLTNRTDIPSEPSNVETGSSKVETVMADLDTSSCSGDLLKTDYVEVESVKDKLVNGETINSEKLHHDKEKEAYLSPLNDTTLAEQDQSPSLVIDKPTTGGQPLDDQVLADLDIVTETLEVDGSCQTFHESSELQNSTANEVAGAAEHPNDVSSSNSCLVPEPDSHADSTTLPSDSQVMLNSQSATCPQTETFPESAQSDIFCSNLTTDSCISSN